MTGLAHRFAAHEVDTDGGVAMNRIRNMMWDAAQLVSCLVPESREQSTALTRLEEAMFWANAGIAREGRE